MPEINIMVVEDEYIVAKDIQNTLKKLGYSVPAIAASGEEAMDKVAEIKPDLVLMDIVLKGPMDGVQTADQIHTKFDIPVVYLTAFADDQTLQRAKVTEPYGYLIKPFQERELHSTIEMALYRQKMEKKLKENERWLATTLNSLGEAVLAADSEGSISFINPVGEWLTGHKYDDSIGKPLKDVLKVKNADTRKLIKDPMEKVLKQDRVVSLAKNSVLVRHDGSEVPVTESGAPIIDDDDNIIGVVFVLQDITDQRTAQEVLRDSEERYRRLVDNFPEPMVVYSEDKLVYVNPESVRLFGAAGPHELIGKSIIEFIHPDNQDELKARLLDIEGGSEIQKSIRPNVVRLDGEVLNVDVSATPISYSGKPSAQIVIKDITTGRKTEEQLRESEEKYRNLVELSSDGIVIVQDGLIKYANPRMEEIAGYNATDVIGTRFIEYLPDDEVPKVLEKYKRRMAGGEVERNYETKIKHKNGDLIHVEINGGVVHLKGELADQVYITDITSRKHSENALRESEENYRRLVENSPDAILVTDLKGKIQMVNREALNLYGFKHEDHIIGKNIFEFFIVEDRERAIANAQKTIQEGTVRNINYKLTQADGSTYHAELSLVLIKDAEDNPKGFITVIRDISDRIKLDEALRDSEQKYFNLFHKSNDSIFLHDLIQRVI
jgi:PAS domain S-box-containing protein